MTASGGEMWHQEHSNVLCQLQVLHMLKELFNTMGNTQIPKMQRIVGETRFKALSPFKPKTFFKSTFPILSASSTVENKTEKNIFLKLLNNFFWQLTMKRICYDKLC